MENRQNIKSIIKGLSFLFVIFGGLSLANFNCAPPAFEVAEQASTSLTLSEDGSIIPTPSDVDSKPVLPNALLTRPQVYQSLLNLTDQAGTVTTTQIQEFDRRSGAFPVSTEVSLVNAPMLLALTSFSGEVCNGLVQREQNLTADSRKYFKSINFSGAASTVSSSIYSEIVTNLSNTFWGRAPSSDELKLFDTYRTDFMAAIPAAQATQAAQTRALVLSTCAAMLSSFEVFTY